MAAAAEATAGAVLLSPSALKLLLLDCLPESAEAERAGRFERVKLRGQYDDDFCAFSVAGVVVESAM